MEWITVTAPSVSEAKERLLDKLGVPDGEAEFVVEDEGESKFFGFRKTEARVKARVLPKGPEPRRDRKKGRNERGQKKRSQNKSSSTDDRSPDSGSTGGNRNRGSKNKPSAPLTKQRVKLTRRNAQPRSDRPRQGSRKKRSAWTR